MGCPMFCFYQHRIFFTGSFLTFRRSGSVPAAAVRKENVCILTQKEFGKRLHDVHFPWYYAGGTGGSPGTGKQAACQPHGEMESSCSIDLLIRLQSPASSMSAPDYLLMGSEPSKRKSKMIFLKYYFGAVYD